MQREIKIFGCDFQCEYEWDDEILVLERVSIDDNDLTELLSDKITAKIESRIYEYYGEDQADKSAWYAEALRERAWGC